MNYEYDLTTAGNPASFWQLSRVRRKRGAQAYFGDFRCLHCRQPVSATPIFSGVKNRNHCPYCLWSRHVDLCVAGDRLAACKEPMRPIGLTIKRTRNKYGPEEVKTSVPAGELMLIHQCAACGKVSINRVAADDIPEMVLATFEDSLTLDAPTQALLAGSGVVPLRAVDLPLVQRRLFGDAAVRGGE
jgi:hypothetical protein